MGQQILVHSLDPDVLAQNFIVTVRYPTYPTDTLKLRIPDHNNGPMYESYERRLFFVYIFNISRNETKGYGVGVAGNGYYHSFVKLASLFYCKGNHRIVEFVSWIRLD